MLSLIIVLLLFLVLLELAAMSTSPTAAARFSVFLSKSSAKDNSPYSMTTQGYIIFVIICMLTRLMLMGLYSSKLNF